jgi:hypothetical protein
MERSDDGLAYEILLYTCCEIVSVKLPERKRQVPIEGCSVQLRRSMK